MPALRGTLDHVVDEQVERASVPAPGRHRGCPLTVNVRSHEVSPC